MECSGWKNRQKNVKMCINNNMQQESVLLIWRQRQTKNYTSTYLTF